MDNLVEKNYFLYQSAKDGFRSYLQSYKSHQLKDVYDVKELDLQKLSKSFGLRVPPNVDLDISLRSKKFKKVIKNQHEPKFFNKNRKQNDERQFSR